MFEQGLREGDASLEMQMSLTKTQLDAAIERALRAEEKAERMQVEVDAIEGVKRCVEKDAGERAEKVRLARNELEIAVRRQLVAEGLALNEKAARRMDGMEATRKNMDARR